MAGGGAASRRRLSGGEGMGWPGLGTVRERGGADGGVCVGRGGLEWRVDGELELAIVRVDDGSVLGFGGGEQAR